MKSGFDNKNIDAATPLYKDFFQYANGGWLKRNPIPKTESRWGSFYELRDQAWEALRNILEEIKRKPAREGTTRAKMQDFYRTAMDEKKIERQGIAPLEKYFEAIGNIKTMADLFRVLGTMHEMGLHALFTPFVDQDEKQSEVTLLHIWQASLVLPDRDYYIKTDKQSKEIRKRYFWYIVRMLVLAGIAKPQATKRAKTILKLETRLAEISRSRTALRDVEKQYYKVTFQQLKKLAPHIDWAAYKQSTPLPKHASIIIGQKEFFRELSTLAGTIPILQWKEYLHWYILDGSAGFLGTSFVKERFQFHGQVISGAKELKPRWKRVVMVMDAVLGEALGEHYVKKYFSKSAKKQIDSLVDHVIRAYAKRIRALGWMSARTKARALGKLHAISRKIAYPNTWRNYSRLEIGQDSYLENFFRAQRFEYHRQLAKIGKPLDRSEWLMTPQTVNACYQPSMNEITFPVGILKPPFFNPDAFLAVNYGGIGSVIGHELTHGFDDQGSKFDAKGNMREWWTKEDRKKFMKRAGLLVKQFDAYTLAGDIHLNGKLTLGENIADLGGVVIAFDALKEAMKNKRTPETIGGWTPEQLFFLGFAQAERGHTRPEEQRRLATIDPHSPSRERTNGPLSNIEEFHEAFGIKKGSAMYRSPDERVKIW